MRVTFILLVFAIGALAQSEERAGYSYPVPGPRPTSPSSSSDSDSQWQRGPCKSKQRQDGTFEFDCGFKNPADRVLARDDILWLYATAEGNQRVVVQLPRYLLKQAITGAVKANNVDYNNDVIVKVPSPEVQVAAFGQDGALELDGKPNVQFEYERSKAAPPVHYSLKRGNLVQVEGVQPPDVQTLAPSRRSVRRVRKRNKVVLDEAAQPVISN